MQQERKAELLVMKMHQLMPTCATFNKWFTRFNDRSIDETSIPTLAEFFARNTKVPVSSDLLWCGQDIPTGLLRSTESYLKLEQFLLENGFDCRDWIGLARQGKQLKLFPLSVLKREEAAEFPVVLFCDKGSIPSKILRGYDLVAQMFPSDNAATITVGQILNLTDDALATSVLAEYVKQDFDRACALLTALQEAFATYGFSGNDGTFMRLEIPKTQQGMIKAHGKRVFKQQSDVWRHAI